MKKSLAILLATLALCGALAVVGTGAASVEVRSSSTIDGKRLYARRLDGYFEIYVSDRGSSYYDPTFEGVYTLTLEFLSPWTGILVLEDAQFVDGLWRRTFAEFRELLPEEDREAWDDSTNKTITLHIYLGEAPDTPTTAPSTTTTRPPTTTSPPTTTANNKTKCTWFDDFWKWLAAVFEALLLPFANAIAHMYA